VKKLCGTRKKKRIRERRKGKCKEFESSYTLLPRGEGAGHNPLLDWTRTGCKRGTRLQFVLVEPRVSDVFVSSLFYRVGPRSSPLFIYTFSSLLGPPCCCWVCMAGSPRSLSIEPMQHFKANLPRVAVNAKEQCPALQTVAHPLTVAASVPVSVSVSVSACYCPSFFSPARSTGLCCHSAPPRREIRGCGLGFGHG
jgi:hypothetical protein